MALARLDCTVTFGQGGAPVVFDAPSVVSTSAVGTVTPEQVTGGGAGPNQPSGMTVVMNGEAMTGTPSAVSEGTWQPGTTDGAGNLITYTNLSPTTPVAQGLAQNSGQWAGNVVLNASGSGMQMNYPPALTGGYSPTRIQAQGFRAQGTGTLYLAYQWMYSANWTNNGNLGTKCFDLKTTAGTQNDILCGQVDVNGTDNATDQYAVLFLQQPGQSQTIPNSAYPALLATQEPNANLAGPNRGTVIKVEVLITQDNPAGGTNATYQVWFNGVSVYGPATGFTILASGQTQGWSGILFDPTYGGGSASPPSLTPNISWTIDHLYISVK